MAKGIAGKTNKGTQFGATQAAHGFAVLDGIYHDGTTWELAQANNDETLAEYVVTAVNGDNFTAMKFGRVTVTGHGNDVGQHYFLSTDTAGKAVTVEPSNYSSPLFYVEDANTIHIEAYRPSVVGSGSGSSASGGGGGLDVFYSESFVDPVTGFTTGQSATFLGGGTATVEPSSEEANQISGDRSLKHLPTALNDYGVAPTIQLDEKQKGNWVGLTAYTTYSGVDPADGDYDLVAYDATNGAILQSVPIKVSSTALRHVMAFYVPASCDNLRWGYHVKTANAGETLLIDDVEISTNPFVSKDLVLIQGRRIQQSNTAILQKTGGNGIRWDLAALTQDESFGDEIVTITDDAGGTRMVANKDCIVNAQFTNFSPNVNLNIDFYRYNSSDTLIEHIKGQHQYNIAGYHANMSASFHMLAGEYFKVVPQQTLYTSVTEFPFHFNATAKSEHVVTPSSVPKQYSEANGDFTITQAGAADWTTYGATAVPYLTGDGSWRMKFNITGSFSAGSGGSATLRFNNTTFKNLANFPQAISVTDLTLQSRAADQYAAAYVNQNSELISILFSHSMSFANSWCLSGDVELESKPTWADPVSSQYLAAIALEDPEVSGDVTMLNGNIVPIDGKGIDFGAATESSGTPTSSVLDDYEEGTWTPGQGGAALVVGGTFSSSGTYVKIGKQVTVNGRVSGSSSISIGATQGTIIQDLPFVIAGSKGVGVTLVGGSVYSIAHRSAWSTSIYSNTTGLTGGETYIDFTLTYLTN